MNLCDQAKLATADDDTVRRLENCFKKLNWARGSSSLLKRFLTKKASRINSIRKMCWSPEECSYFLII